MTLYGANFYLEFSAKDDATAHQVAELIARVHNKCANGVASHVCDGTILPVAEPIEGEIVEMDS